MDHFAKYKSSGPALLIFDGVLCHLDANIIEAVDAHEVTLFCLPSNTTHELQSMDKKLFRAYESYWDEEMMLLWTQQACGQGDSIEEISADWIIRKGKFGKIFSRAWMKAATLSNVMCGFKATGIYHFDTSAIKDEAFAVSELTQRPDPTGEENYTLKDKSIESDINEQNKEPKKTSKVSGSSLSDSEFSTHDSLSDSFDVSDRETESLVNDPSEKSFSAMLRTPDASRNTNKKLHRKAINYQAQKVIACLFENDGEAKAENKLTKYKEATRKTQNRNIKSKVIVLGNDKNKRKRTEELLPSSSDINLKNKKNNEMHILLGFEECEGVTKQDKIPYFQCTSCLDL
ncbi:DDE superfamily endonuclease [Popillia japonica]|uniref:DDE superfamily endonuclease n=1 Tax=Popillia japonica TaxID=7064 RepID=A0AAW1HWS9_POPJA